MKKLTLPLLLICCLYKTWAQPNATPQQLLFCHLDKTIYTNNETIWFSGYLAKVYDSLALRQKYLWVKLINNTTKKEYADSRLTIDNGISMGRIRIPDTTPTGRYTFMAMSNIFINGKPITLFTQTITVKNIINNNIKLSTTLSNPINKQMTLGIRVETDEYKPIEKAKITYTNNGIHYKTIYTNQWGVADIPIMQHDSNSIIQLRADYKNEYQLKTINIPAARAVDTTLQVSFTPESGNLLQGVTNTVGLEITDYQGNPISAKAYLFNQNILLDSIFTNTSGIASFTFIPEKKSEYYLQLIHGKYVNNKKKYYLPTIKNDAVIINVSTALFNDTAKFNLITNHAKKVNIYIHNSTDTFAFTPFYAKATINKIVVPLLPDEVPKGLVLATITDSLNNLLAQRILFAHYKENNGINLTTDKISYKKNDSATLTLELDSLVTNYEQIIGSLAVVQNNRIDPYNQNNIEINNYLKASINQFPPFKDGISQNASLLEKGLLSTNFIKYHINKPISYNLIDENDLFIYEVLDKRKPMNNENFFLLKNGQFLNLLSTNAMSNFALKYKDLIINQNEFLKIKLTKDDNSETEVKEIIDKKTMEGISTLISEIKDEYKEVNNNSIELPTLKEKKGVKRLKDVTVKSNNFITNANKCGDYVCIAGKIVNCIVHTKPHQIFPANYGEAYKVGYFENGNLIRSELKLYLGCSQAYAKSLIKPIYNSTNSYNIEEESKNNFSLAKNYTTLFWQPGIVLRKGGKINFTFYTGDITGPFKIVLQGIASNNSVFYKEAVIKVE